MPYAGMGFRTGKILEVPLSVIAPGLLAAFGLSYVLNKSSQNYSPWPATFSSEFLAEANKIGNVAQRTEAPAVFLDPIRNGVPGSVLGPDDLVEASDE